MTSCDKEKFAKQLEQYVDESNAQALAQYLAMLAQWNQAYNLTAIRDPKDMFVKHILDSLSIVDHIRGDSILDVGTGGGLPGIVLAITFPQKQFTLLDSNGKKTRFLTQAAYDLSLKNVTVVHARVEEYEGQFDCIVSRAFTELKNFIDLTKHLAAPKGCWLAMKGPTAESECRALELPYERITLTVPELEDARELVLVHF